jgi:hypothetical protein
MGLDWQTQWRHFGTIKFILGLV